MVMKVVLIYINGMKKNVILLYFLILGFKYSLMLKVQLVICVFVHPTIIVYLFSINNSLVIAVGGRENDIALYDVETQDAVFKGRNVPFDFLNMRVPIWVADMQVTFS